MLYREWQDPSLAEMALTRLKQDASPPDFLLPWVVQMAENQSYTALAVIAHYGTRAGVYVERLEPLLINVGEQDEVIKTLTAITGKSQEQLRDHYFYDRYHEDRSRPFGVLRNPEIAFKAKGGLFSIPSRRILSAEQIRNGLAPGSSNDILLSTLSALADRGAESHFVVPQLCRLASHTSPIVRASAIYTLGAAALGSHQAEITILDATQSKTAFIRASAAEALGSAGIRSPAVFSRLRMLLNDPDHDVVLAALSACVQLEVPSSFTTSMIHLLKSKDGQAQILACDCLGGMGSDAKSATSTLKQLLKDPYLTIYVDCALQRISGNNTHSRYDSMMFRGAPPPLKNIPQFSSREQLDIKVLARPDGKVNDLYSTLIQRLNDGQYSQDHLWLYSVKGGFALVTDVERINEDGTPDKRHRWELGHIPLRDYSLGAYLKALVFGTSDFYRFWLIVLTPDDVVNSGPLLSTEDEAKRWVGYGGSILPQTLGRENLNDRHCFLMVYEYERRGKSNSFTYYGKKSVRDHLTQTGLALPVIRKQ
jgi:hypothetical protein